MAGLAAMQSLRFAQSAQFCDVLRLHLRLAGVAS